MKMIKFLMMSVTLASFSLSVTAQSNKAEKPALINQERISSDKPALFGIKNYEQYGENDLLPITREQAEKLISKLVVKARAEAQRMKYEDRALQKFKLETLKRHILDEALREYYGIGNSTLELEKKISRLEGMVLALASTKGNINPSAITAILGGTPNGNNTFVLPEVQQVPSQSGMVQHNPDVPNSAEELANHLSDDNVVAEPTNNVMQDTAHKPIPMAPGAKVASFEHFLSQVFFGFDSAKLTEESEKVLDDIVAWMADNKVELSLKGYASIDGNIDYNNKLSAYRVNAVANYLVSKGISRDKLHVNPAGLDSMQDTTSKYPSARRVDIRPYYGK